MVTLIDFEKKGRLKASFFLFSSRLKATLTILPFLLVASCGPVTITNRFEEIDARARGDLFVPEDAPSPQLILVDEKAMTRLDGGLKEFLLASGGGVYDPNTQTIYIDESRYREGILGHELVHHYVRFMSESQRIECLARLYEVHVSSNSSFAGCPRQL